MRRVMKLQQHLKAAVVVSGAVTLATWSPWAGLGAFLSCGWLDLDHAVDFLWGRREVRPRPTLKSYLRRRSLKRCIRLAHSFEWVVLALVLAALWHSLFCLGLAAGWAVHLAQDFRHHRGKHLNNYFYFIIYRIPRAFLRQRMFKPQYW